MKKHLINEQITAPKVRLIDQNGEQVGIISLRDAQNKAEQAGLDLVEMATGDVPVCKLLDYRKHLFEEKKKLQLSKKKQKKVELKEVVMRPRTDVADYQVKIKKVQQFLSDKNKVKITILHKGRELAHTEIGHKLMQRVIEDTQDYAVPESEPKFENRQIFVLLTPTKK